MKMYCLEIQDFNLLNNNFLSLKKLSDEIMLEELFFHEKVAKIIEHFIIHEKWVQNKKELCEILEIYPELMRDILKKLMEFDLIKVTKQIARSKFYRLNEKSELLPHLRGLVQDFGILTSLKIAEEELEIKKKEENDDHKLKLKKVNLNE